MVCSSSVVVSDLNALGAVVLPYEANPNFTVHPDRVLPRTIPVERMQLLSGRAIQVPKFLRSLYHSEFASGHLNQASGKALGALAVVDRLRNLVPEAPDRHGLKYRSVIRIAQ